MHEEEKAPLSPFEARAMKLLRFLNEDPRARLFQQQFIRQVGVRWVSTCIERLLHVEGLDKLHRLDPSGGVIVCANHRSFFDGYIISCVCFQAQIPWYQRVRFPVRANFFYERPAGVLVNLAVGAGSMYPPIFRDPKKAAYNKESLDWLTSILSEYGNVVGLHPEGTRGKGPDPYELLPAQPGVGQIIARSGAPVVPVWVNGLSNRFVEQVVSNFRTGARRGDPIIVVFGDPVDLSSFAGQKPRPALYKKIADHTLDAIRRLGEQERVIRTDLLRTWR